MNASKYSLWRWWFDYKNMEYELTSLRLLSVIHKLLCLRLTIFFRNETLVRTEARCVERRFRMFENLYRTVCTRVFRPILNTERKKSWSIWYCRTTISLKKYDIDFIFRQCVSVWLSRPDFHHVCCCYLWYLSSRSSGATTSCLQPRQANTPLTSLFLLSVFVYISFIRIIFVVKFNWFWLTINSDVDYWGS